MSISVQWESKGFLIKAKKVVDFDELSAQFSEVVADHRYANCQYALLEASEVNFLDMDLDKLQNVANSFLKGEERTEQFKFALVFKEGSVEEEVEHYLSLTAHTSRQVHSFHYLNEARQWLE